MKQQFRQLSRAEIISLILAYIENGQSKVDTARATGISRETVRFHVKRWLRGEYDDINGMPRVPDESRIVRTFREETAPPPAPKPSQDEAPEPDYMERGNLILKLRRGEYSLDDLAEMMHCTKGQALDVMDELMDSGINLHLFGGKYSIARTPIQGQQRYPDRFEYPSDDDGWFKFGLVSDTHLGSKYARLDVLNDIYDIFAAEEITRVYHAGNWIEGVAHFNKFDLLPEAHGLEPQVDLFIRDYPQRPGITTYYIDGDDHEGWFCFDNRAEIMTRERGWVKFADLTDDDDVATMTPQGRFEWQRPTARPSFPYAGDLVTFKARSLDFAVTPNHRLLCRTRPSLHGPETQDVLTAQEVYDTFKSRCVGIVCTSTDWQGTLTPVIDIPRVESTRYKNHAKIQHFGSQSVYDIAELLGWYVTEGWVHQGTFGIAQSPTANPANCQRIEALLARIGAKVSRGDKSFRVCSPELAQYVVTQCGKGAYHKYLPQWLKDQPRDVLQVLFDAMIAGDGSYKTFGWRFYSWSKRLRDDMTEIAQKLGYAVVENEKHHSLSIRPLHCNPWLVQRPTLTHYDGMVYCVTVPNERIYVRSGGKAFWSMNSQREGIEVGRFAEMKAAKAGREDLKYLSYMEAFITLRHAKTDAINHMLVQHPGGGSAYAESYTIQKIIESFQGGEKPGVLVCGHYHKMSYNLVRSVHAVQPGCTKDQDIFGRKKRLHYTIGGMMVRMRMDENGAITRFLPEFLQYFHRGYYRDQWSLSGPIHQPPMTRKADVYAR